MESVKRKKKKRKEEKQAEDREISLEKERDQNDWSFKQN